MFFMTDSLVFTIFAFTIYFLHLLIIIICGERHYSIVTIAMQVSKSKRNSGLPSELLVTVLETCAKLAGWSENREYREFSVRCCWECVELWYGGRRKPLGWHVYQFLECPGPKPGWWILLGYVRARKWQKMAMKLARDARKLSKEDADLMTQVMFRVLGTDYYAQSRCIPKSYFDDHPAFCEVVRKLIKMGPMVFRFKHEDIEDYVDETIRAMTVGLPPEKAAKMTNLRDHWQDPHPSSLAFKAKMSSKEAREKNALLAKSKQTTPIHEETPRARTSRRYREAIADKKFQIALRKSQRANL